MINLFFLITFLNFVNFIINAYDIQQMNTCVWLSGAAYCGKEKYGYMKVAGPASGFIHRYSLYDPKTDLEGYIGIIPNYKTIYVVFRGSSSKLNWLDDFEVKKVPYLTFPECNCAVHNGFYKSALGVRNDTLRIVRELKRKYPIYKVIVTGHSYGASTGQLIAMELAQVGIKVGLYNFGQPRVGDIKYAGFVNTIIKDYWRVTHYKDIVPHVPPIEVFNYYHSCREVFEDSKGYLNLCSEVNCEDPKCADQYKLIQTNGTDHSYYLNHHLTCEESVYK